MNTYIDPVTGQTRVRAFANTNGMDPLVHARTFPRSDATINRYIGNLDELIGQRRQTILDELDRLERSCKSELRAVARKRAELLGIVPMGRT